MPTNPGDAAPTLEVHIRRAVWIVWGVTMLVASVLYALKAAEDRSAFVRWRHQVLEIGDGVDIWNRFYFPNPPILPLTLYPLMLLPPVAGAMAQLSPFWRVSSGARRALSVGAPAAKAATSSGGRVRLSATSRLKGAKAVGRKGRPAPATRSASARVASSGRAARRARSRKARSSSTSSGAT